MHMTIVERISISEARPFIDQLLLINEPSGSVSRKVAEKYGVLFEPSAIEQYRQELSKSGDNPLQQIVKVTQDISNNEMPPTDEFSKLSLNFSFQKTNEDLDLIYARVRSLRAHAEANPDDPTFDRRIKDYLSQAEAIRTRVFRHQYEQIRHAILLTVGKKLCTAAISILIPYIHKEHKAEAMRRFQSAVESLLDIKSVPDMPADIADMNDGDES